MIGRMELFYEMGQLQEDQIARDGVVRNLVWDMLSLKCLLDAQVGI